MVGVVLAVAAGLAACGHEPSGHQVAPKSAVLLVYLRPQQVYFPKALGALEKSYESEIAKVPANDAMTSAFRSVVNSTPWISRMAIGKFDPERKNTIDIKQYAKYDSDESLDAVVIVWPLAEFTPGLKGLMVSATIVVEKDSPVGPVKIKRKDIVETISLENAGAPLSSEQLASFHVSDHRQAEQARAAIWFSHHAARIKTGLLLDLSVMNQHARTFLETPLEN